MKQREALNSIYNDIIKISKKRNRVLTIALAVSILINLALLLTILQIKVENIATDEAAMLTAVAVKKPSEHIITRNKLKEIPDIVTFEQLLNRCILSENDKHILREHYLHEKSFVAIALEMGYSEDTIKHRHQKILKKIKKLL